MFNIRILFTIIFITTCFFASAQFEKGKYTVGLGLSSELTLTNTDASIHLDRTNLELGYFFQNRWEVGVSGDFYSQNSNYFSRTRYGLGAYSRYYFSDKKFTPYADAFIGGGRLIGKFEGTDEFNYDQTYLRAALGFGVNYKITKGLTAQAGLRYNFNEFFDGSDLNRDRLNLNVGMKYSF